MRTTLFLLHAISCCWLGSATLSKTDVKKSHKAEAEVSNLKWVWAVRSYKSSSVCLACHWSYLMFADSGRGPYPPHLSFVHSWWCLSATEMGSFFLSPWSLCLGISSWVVCVGERPRCVRPALERHSEGRKETLCSRQENISRTSAWICHTCKSQVQPTLTSTVSLAAVQHLSTLLALKDRFSFKSVLMQHSHAQMHIGRVCLCSYSFILL